MSPCYLVEPIAPQTVDRAYALAKACGCALTLREWRLFCQALVPASAWDETAGERDHALTARDVRGYVKGLCVYSIANDPSYGRLLDVPIFVVGSAADSQGVTRELVGALRSECGGTACSGIRFWPLAHDAWMRRRRRQAFGRRDQTLFLRPLASVAEMAGAVGARTFKAAAL